MLGPQFLWPVCCDDCTLCTTEECQSEPFSLPVSSEHIVAFNLKESVEAGSNLSHKNEQIKSCITNFFGELCCCFQSLHVLKTSSSICCATGPGSRWLKRSARHIAWKRIPAEYRPRIKDLSPHHLLASELPRGGPALSGRVAGPRAWRRARAAGLTRVRLAGPAGPLTSGRLVRELARPRALGPSEVRDRTGRDRAAVTAAAKLKT